MRLWVLTGEYEPRIIGGLGVVATHLSRALASGYPELEVVVLTHAHEEERIAREGPVTVVRFRADPARGRRLDEGDPILALARRHGLGPPHAVHVHSVSFGDLALRLRRRLGVPVVYTCHSLVCNEPFSPARPPVEAAQERLLAGADLVVAPSEWQRRGIADAYAGCAGKVRVIPNGADLPDLPPAARRSASPRRRESSLLFAGRLVTQKGIEPMLPAVAALRHRGLPVTLDVVGHGDRAFQAELADVARRLGVAEHVRWRGFLPRSEMDGVYGSHDFVVVPSQQESFGLVALEAMACGVPLVSTRSGGLSDLVDERVAQVIPQVEWPAIADAVQMAMVGGERTAARVTEGRRRAEWHAWPRVARSYRALLEEAGRAAPRGG